jgi:hypothetical protein
MTKQQQFFYDNAGYSYDPKKESAKQGKYNNARRMAKSERLARLAGVRFNWEYDTEGCTGCSCDSADCACSSGEPHETLGCIAVLEDGSHGASLWSICGATREYRRVVEAELAMECGF